MRQGLTLTSLSVGGASVRQGAHADLSPPGRGRCEARAHTDLSQHGRSQCEAGAHASGQGARGMSWASTGHREGGAGPHAGCWEAGRDFAPGGSRGGRSRACRGCSPTSAGPVQGRQELGPKNLAGESSGPTKAVGSWAGVEPKELAYLLGGRAGRGRLQDNLGLQRSPGGPSLAWRSPPTRDHLGSADAIGGQELILERPP